MAMGDAFIEPEIAPYEWAYFAHLCGLRPQLISREPRILSAKLLEAMDRARQDVMELFLETLPPNK